ncbi:WD40/YVTN/BNR-like repeat-containing protein [Cycloclasticus pugetii]|uniref:WD40/YVTN/BNR-like repeat-containing protein n=1 Tax=Cycloclasticus pugetii TaxID=34068 RepID=UPI003A9203AF
MTRSIHSIFTSLIASCLLASSGTMFAASTVEALDRSSIDTQLGNQSVLLDVASVNNELYAVGERGLILKSDDGFQWEQQKSPVSVTLTGISFSDDLHGYAIGHGGVVLKTINGGKNWTKIWDGRVMANQLLAKSKLEGDAEKIRHRQHLVDDGPDKPFLDLLQIGPDHVVVVGAYGLVFETKDGGETWQPWMDRIENFFGAHLYSIRKRDDQILIAGEMGFVALSDDAGETFTTLETPYEGSYFTSELLQDGRILLSGLRGNTFTSSDNGESWTSIFNPIAASITASTTLSDGKVVLVSQAGLIQFLEGDSLVVTKHHAFPPLTNVFQTSKGDLLTLSIHGAISVSKGGLQ